MGGERRASSGRAADSGSGGSGGRTRRASSSRLSRTAARLAAVFVLCSHLAGCFVGLAGATTTLRLGSAAGTAAGLARAAGLANHMRVASLAVANEARLAGYGVRSFVLRERSGAAVAHARMQAGRFELADGARRPLITARLEGDEIVHRAPQGTVVGRTWPNADRTRFEHRDAEGRFFGHDEVIGDRRVRHFGPDGALLGESVLYEEAGAAVTAGTAGATTLLLAAVPDGDCAALGQLWRACQRGPAPALACEDFATVGLACLQQRLLPPPGMVPGDTGVTPQ